MNSAGHTSADISDLPHRMSACDPKLTGMSQRLGEVARGPTYVYHAKNWHKNPSVLGDWLLGGSTCPHFTTCTRLQRWPDGLLSHSNCRCCPDPRFKHSKPSNSGQRCAISRHIHQYLRIASGYFCLLHRSNPGPLCSTFGRSGPRLGGLSKRSTR